MKLARFIHSNKEQLGCVTEQQVIAIPETLFAGSMAELLSRFASLKAALEQLIETASQPLAIDDIQLLAPIAQPEKFIGVGLNYQDHIDETELAVPEFPTLFNKQSSCITHPGSPIYRPHVSDKLDYEGELALVIGQYCRNISEQDAAKVIAGYTIVNDVSVRDWQIKSPTWTLGKSFDSHGPMGPWIVTADSIDPHNLELKTWLNDELRQHSNTRHLIFNCYQLVATLSSVCTLKPGDIIATGTCSGVGVKMKPRGYMKPGDQITIEIENIGRLSNPILQEPEHNSFISPDPLS
ncbi:fumarylacetoacetate hydrolase family protein [Amphritea sp. 1_MG-2023]|uniref:fumarylacetoacetate hydrolase family protein n=1 Tax=Amphritea sp. 1_MG-2023 TaxID=3062670 RepID=UPI0026E2F00C|nr:fumarylacetoacetate hydrolase family protein [Amphritea sp. 1_MG-2023]MDO6562199.1 fumarylacetoacetate hydrolase family protein [Amphritea sp. 1_MG-2023]